MAKRLLDIALAGFLLLFFAPLLVVIAFWVWLDSGLPVLYCQVRAGRGGKPFWIVKFRTMVFKKTSQDLPITSANDPRITRTGRILRRLKLDELPQLWNVLRGDMSFVGPRPQTFSLLPYYPPEDLQVILSIRPGLTGPTQLWLKDEEEVLAQARDPMAYYVEVLLPQKIASDRAYVENRSLRLDFWIIWQTLLVLFFPRFAPSAPPAPVQGRRFIVRG